MIKLLFILIFFNQNPDPVRDSLLLELKTSQKPDKKASIYYNLAKQLYGSDQNLAIAYADSAICFGELSNNQKMTANAINIKAVAYLIKSDFETSTKLNLEALKIRESIQDTVGLLESHLNLGNILYRQGKSNEAIGRYKKSLEYAKMINSQRGLSLLYNNIGSYYRDRWNSTDAKVDLDSARFYLLQSLDIKTKLNDSRAQIHTLNQLSELAQGEKDYMIAENYLKRSLEISQGVEDGELQISILTQLSQFNLEVGDKAQALDFALRSYAIAEDMEATYMISSTSGFVANAYEALGDYKNALDFNKRKIKADQQLNNETKQKIQQDLLIQYESEKKELENQRLLEEQRFLDLTLRRKNELLIGAGIILLGLVGVGFFQRRKNRQLAIAQQSLNMTLGQLTEKNEEIEKKSLLLSQVNSNLKESNSIRERFLSVVSHDVKAPLNSLQLLLDYWDQKILSVEELNDLIPRISKQTKTVQNLLKNLLEWAQTQMEYSKLQFSEVNLRELVEESIRFAAPSAEGKKVNIINLIPEELTLRSDRDRLNFIIRNLVSNALKFTNSDGQVVVSFDNGKIQVADNGIGMSKKRLESLFAQGMGPSTGTDGEKGSGIGLLLCKEFAESLGAKLEVVSELNKGSTFSVNLG